MPNHVLKSSVVLAGLYCLGYAQAQDIEEPTIELVIAGGALASDTTDVWEQFIGGARPEGPIVIVPSSSRSPVQSGASVSETLQRYGVAPDRIAIAELAMRDDGSTENVDEALWASNYDDPATVELLGSAAAIWFTGGSQSRTTTILLDEKDEDTAALAAIRAAASDGAPIGGTSAGAAIMSTSMLRQGDSLTALTGSDEGEPIKIGSGLGFFSFGLVDQHFGERARLGRLVTALSLEPDPAKRVGFGVDENTALIVTGDGSAQVGGTGYVTIIDARDAEFSLIDGTRLQAKGLMVHLMSAGDTLDFETLSLKPAAWKDATIGDEYVEAPLPGGGGMAIRGQMLADVIGEGLVDNEGSETVRRISFDSAGRGVAFVFTQTSASEGYWGRGPDGEARYSITSITFDISPMDLTFEELE